MAITDISQTGSATSLTSSYKDTTGWVQVSNSGWATFLIAWTQGDETSIQAAIDITSGGVTCRYPMESPSAGVTTSKPNAWTFAKADWTGLNPPVAAKVGVALARLLVKATGGTPTGSVTVTSQESDND